MAEQLEGATEGAVTQEEQKSGGIGVSGVVGGAAGIVGGGYGAATYISNSNIRKEIVGDAAKKATEKYSTLVKDVLDDAKNADLKTASEQLPKTKSFVEKIGKNPEIVSKIEVVEKAAVGDKAASKVLQVTENGVQHEIGALKKAPKDLKTAVTEADAIKKLLEGEKNAVKNVVRSEETALVNAIRKTSGLKNNLKAMGNGEKAAVGAVILVGAYAGAKVFHTIFGGSHTNKVTAPAEQPTVGRS